MTEKGHTVTVSDVTGLVMAGGRATRMGGVDKGLVLFEGRPLAEHVVRRLAPQCRTLLVSANRNLSAYRALGLTPVTDRIPGFAGPLAGWEAACAVAKTKYVMSVPCDSPRVPENLAAKLSAALTAHPEARAAAPTVNGKKEPVFALFESRLGDELAKALASGEHRVGMWLEGIGCVWVPFDDPAPFANFNTLEDLKMAENQS